MNKMIKINKLKAKIKKLKLMAAGQDSDGCVIYPGIKKEEKK